MPTVKELENAFEREPRLGRFLCHLSQRLQAERLNLVVGAGISIDAGVPGWGDLLERLAGKSSAMLGDLKAHKDSGLNPEYLGQIIYHRHKNDFSDTVSDDLLQVSIDNSWADAIHKGIYEKVTGGIDQILSEHPYLSDLQELAQKIPLVINFNFDDLLSEAIGHSISSAAQSGTQRSYTVTWHPPSVDRPNTTTIYHVNGVLPRLSLKKRSPQLIFTEDSFANALERSPGVSGEYLFLRFVQNTMLIIGHSLGDSSLKNYLRRNRTNTPANHHYMIYWIKHHESMSTEQRKDIFEANLELYNTITVFLTSDEIRAVFHLLNHEQRDLRDAVEEMGQDKLSRFHYYIVGPVAAGKSTLLEQLRCFNTLEEWTRPPPQVMYRSSDTLSEEEKAEVNSFVYSELKEKNIRMTSLGVGIHFMDRAPLDLYAFSKDDAERKEKTQDLQSNVLKDQSFQQGEVIFLTARGATLVKRNLGRGRAPTSSGDAEYLEQQATFLNELYNPEFVLYTDKYDAGEIARKVAHHALFGKYAPCDLNRIMEKYT